MADPATMAGAMVLQTMANADARRRQERQAAADAERQRRSNLMSAMNAMGSGIS